METKLIRIAELAKSQPKMQFTAFAHLVNEETLKKSHHELPNNKASGINQTTRKLMGSGLNNLLASEY